jgi:putative protein-disulfide isomerase
LILLAFFNIQPCKTLEYSELATKFGFDKNDFSQKQKDVHFLKLAEKDFQLSDSLNVSGFPTVFYVNEKNQAWAISRGFVSLHDLKENFSKALSY